MIIEILLFSIVIGIIRGGSLRNFYYFFIKKTWVIVLGLAIQFGVFYFGLRGYDLVLNNVERIYILSYLVILLGIILNIRFREVFIIGIGSVVNLIVFVYNNGSIPILKDSLRYLGVEGSLQIVEGGQFEFFTPILEATKFGFLGHIISVPHPYPYPQIISVGDLIMGIGLLLLIQRVMMSPQSGGNKTLRFGYRSKIK